MPGFIKNTFLPKIEWGFTFNTSVNIPPLSTIVLSLFTVTNNFFFVWGVIYFNYKKYRQKTVTRRIFNWLLSIFS